MSVVEEQIEGGAYIHLPEEKSVCVFGTGTV